ncbi:hypothetical protein [Biostraticola tofi]|uniref:hypothetical protein n=1 Tax=Biostraticola tofi TaxID=466109 RepID=UPI001E4CA8D7|nr:hypothetical protein [Biostraticola tofi]
MQKRFLIAGSSGLETFRAALSEKTDNLLATVTPRKCLIAVVIHALSLSELLNNGIRIMINRFFICAFVVLSFSVSAANGGDGGDGGNGADGGNGSNGDRSDNTTGRRGCPGGTDPDPAGRFYFPGTQEQCNPGKQDVSKNTPKN